MKIVFTLLAVLFFGLFSIIGIFHTVENAVLARYDLDPYKAAQIKEYAPMIFEEQMQTVPVPVPGKKGE